MVLFNRLSSIDAHADTNGVGVAARKWLEVHPESLRPRGHRRELPERDPDGGHYPRDTAARRRRRQAVRQTCAQIVVDIADVGPAEDQSAELDRHQAGSGNEAMGA